MQKAGTFALHTLVSLALGAGGTLWVVGQQTSEAPPALIPSKSAAGATETPSLAHSEALPGLTQTPEGPENEWRLNPAYLWEQRLSTARQKIRFGVHQHQQETRARLLAEQEKRTLALAAQRRAQEQAAQEQAAQEQAAREAQELRSAALRARDAQRKSELILAQTLAAQARHEAELARETRLRQEAENRLQAQANSRQSRHDSILALHAQHQLIATLQNREAERRRRAEEQHRKEREQSERGKPSPQATDQACPEPQRKPPREQRSTAR